MGVHLMASKGSDAVISLFCGAGGMSLGFASAGSKPVLAADIDGDACATYRKNLGIDAVETNLAVPSERLLVWCRSIAITIFFGRSDPRCQEEPSPSMGEAWVGVVSPQYNR